MSNPFAQIFAPFNFGFNNYYTPQQTYYPVQYNLSVFNGYNTGYTSNPNNIKGERLFQNALAGIPAQHPDPPMCARYVKNAIVRTGLGPYVLGNGEQAKYMLRANPNFREVKVAGEDLKDLPVGTVITYDAYDMGMIGEDGHVTVKGPGETAVSDRFEDFIVPSDNAHVFVLA